MTTALVPYSDMERMAIAVSKSNLFGMKTPEQAMSLMLIAQAEGVHPAKAIQDYHAKRRRLLAPAPGEVRVYHHLLRDGAVSIEALARALRGSGLAIRVDPFTGVEVIHLDPDPTRPAA